MGAGEYDLNFLDVDVRISDMSTGIPSGIVIYREMAFACRRARREYPSRT